MRMFIIILVTVAVSSIPASYIVLGPVGGMITVLITAIVAPPVLFLAIWKLYRASNAPVERSAGTRMGMFISLLGLSTLLFFSLILTYETFLSP